jgi:hypothetical protein
MKKLTTILPVRPLVATLMAVVIAATTMTTFVVGTHSVQATTSTWEQVGADIDGEFDDGKFGNSVALSSDGTRVAIGEDQYSAVGKSYVGRVRVYDWDGSSWTQVGDDIVGENASDQSGGAVAISSDGSRVAIGAYLNNGSFPTAGHVRVYDLIGATWTQVGADIDGEAEGDLSGSSVAISSDGSRVAIGAYGNDGAVADSGVGHVRVYDWNGSSWTQVGADIDGEAANDWSGEMSIAMSSSGSRVAIGAPRNDGNGPESGHVRVYDLIGATWTQVGADIDGEAADDRAGTSVAMSSNGSRIVIGAPRNDGAGSNAGHVRVYDLVGATWTQVGADIDGEAAGDRAGTSVAMSSSGSRIAIGASNNDGAGSNAGHVRVYDLVGTTWTQVGADIDGEAADDLSGGAVAMSSNGFRVAIGAILNDSIESNAGHVRIFGTEPDEPAPGPNTGGGSTPGSGDSGSTSGSSTGGQAASNVPTDAEIAEFKSASLVPDAEVVAGESYVVSADGFTPSESVNGYLQGSSTSLGSKTANSVGKASVSIKIPSSASGRTTLVLFGNNSRHGVKQAITIKKAASELPATGSDFDLMWIALTALFAGAVTVGATRRQRLVK